MNKRIIGIDYAIIDVLASLYSNGHVLIEGVPGLAKTRLASTLAEVLGMEFSRIQFTPDLMPSDITGSTVFNLKSQEFHFVQGPVFSNVLLCDEVNRAPPKTQSALLEAMEEKQVSADGITYPLPRPFFVIATQNPIEQAGTYSLPEAQLDRFLIRQFISYPTEESEFSILQSKRDHGELPAVEIVANGSMISDIQKYVTTVTISDKVLQYIVHLVRKSREQFGLALGASPRASIALLNLSRAKAAMEGRDFVQPDDVKRMVFPVLNHRIIMTAEAELDALSIGQIVTDIIKNTPVVL